MDLLTEDSIRDLVSNNTDIEFLKELKDSMDVDIENTGKGPANILKIKAQLSDVDVSTYIENKIQVLQELKEFIHERIVELEDGQE